MRKFKLLTASLLFITQIASADNLSYELFKNPGSEYRPSTWLHSMSANMSKEGMTKDLEAIEGAGLGGVLLFNVSQKIPYGDIEYASAEHIEILAHAAKECERLGLSFGFHNCDGWSSSGGPWITPEESMKMLVYRQVVTKGGRVNITLPQPTMRRNFYKELAVLAYPANDGDIADMNSQMAKVTASDSSFDTSVVTDLRADALSILKKTGNTPASVTIDYGSPKAMRSVTATVSNGVSKAKLYGSVDGENFDYITTLNWHRTGKSEAIQVANFEPTNARYYKLEFASTTPVKDIQLSHNKLFDGYLGKSVMGRVEDELLVDVPATDKYDAINSKEVIDLTKYLGKNGQLKAKLPRGEWTIMRIGYTTTEAMNHPASDAGRGLECDKFSSEAIEKHFNEFSKRVINSAKKVAPNALQYIEIDSYEMGGQNWTDKLPEEFSKRKGYDLMEYLPLLLGKCVNSNDKSDAMLSDFREVCCNLMTENYFNRFGELCHENGLKYYVEPYGNGPLNSLDITKQCDIPMGEFWMDKDYVIGKGGISGAHVYGKNIISAESFTSNPAINWKGHPAMIKAAGDMAWKSGVNEFMFHRFAHQANTHVMPGMTMGAWGFHFDRTQTWWNNAGKGWFKYLTRGSYLLRLGVPVSDLLVFLGDGSPATGFTYPNEYTGFRHDYVNDDVLINRMKVVGKELVLPEGTKYKVLALRNSKDMKIETLRRIAEFAEAGIPLVGELPTSLWGMVDITDSASKTELKNLVDKIKRLPNYYPTMDLSKQENELNITPDFKVTNSDKVVDFFHRHVAQDGCAEIYFISNPSSKATTYDCLFRVRGKVPELWDAVSGKREQVNSWSINGSQTSLSLELDPKESVFVVFKENTTETSFNKNINPEVIKTADLNSDWSVEFQKFYGFDQTLTFDKLIDWSKSDNDEVKYYSGTATYRKEIAIDQATLATSDEVILDLGNVQIAAEIFVNGEKVCIDWIAPFRNDIHSYLKPGANLIEVQVTNQWTNRLIGDERYPVQNGGFVQDKGVHPVEKMPRWYVENKPMPEGPRITFTTWPFYKKNSPLISAGLVGPVKLEFIDLQ